MLHSCQEIKRKEAQGCNALHSEPQEAETSSHPAAEGLSYGAEFWLLVQHQDVPWWFRPESMGPLGSSLV